MQPITPADEETVDLIDTISNTGTVAPRRVWDNYEELGEVQISDNNKYIFAAATRKGFRYVRMTQMVRGKDGKRWIHGKGGFHAPILSPDKDGNMTTPLADLCQALQETAAYAATMELMNEEKAVWKKGYNYEKNK